ncbi:MAG: hypothetical protein HY518_00620 [Candidatus Aenigmarchaeota archaeon]|nr:hypothetical protein [Candidatus Aenigmarchaeota archaeon]
MIPERKAEGIAEKAARKGGLRDPALTLRELRGNVWTIEFESKVDLDAKITVRIDAESGNVIEAVKGKAEETPKITGKPWDI